MSDKSMARPMVKAVGPLLLREDDLGNIDLYKESLDMLYAICERYNARIDLTWPSVVYVTGATKSCRKHIRRVYGEHSILAHKGTMVSLRGFKSE